MEIKLVFSNREIKDLKSMFNRSTDKTDPFN